MKEGLADLLIPNGGPGEGGDAKVDGLVSEAVEAGEGQNSVTECQVPPAGVDDGAESTVAKDAVEEPPGDWLEPLEDDEDEEEDWQSNDHDSSVLVNGSKESQTRGRSTSLGVHRRRRKTEDDWQDWPLLGEGWKRRQVFRRSGNSVGQSDTYYMSPTGERARSTVELIKIMAGALDLSNFEFKSGRFMEEGTIRRRKRHRRGDNAASTEDGTPSERSFSSGKTGTPERSHTPHSQVVTPQRPLLTPQQATVPRSPQSPSSFCSPPRLVRASPIGGVTPTRRTSSAPSLQFAEFSPQRLSGGSTPSREPLFPQLAPTWLSSSLAPISPTSSPERDVTTTPEGTGMLKSSPALSLRVSKLSPRTVAISHPSDTNSQGEEDGPVFAGSAGPLVYGCSKCGCSYPGMVFRRPDQKSLCPKCSPEKPLDPPRSIVFRKWLPCGQCRACQVTQDCGTCASCRHGLLNPTSLKPVRCRKRKCLCPIRKDGHGQWVLGKASDIKERLASPQKKTDKISKFGRKLKITRTTRVRRQYAETRRYKKPHSAPQYSDNEDVSGYYDDNDEYGPKKRSRRACWKCDACLRTTDCGRCDFCMDKPKFGGRNKKRQKCRLRQCQSHAMRHLLPMHKMGRPRVRQKKRRDDYWSRRIRPPTHRPTWDDVELTNDEDEEGYIGTLRPGHYDFDYEDDGEEADLDVAAQMNSDLNCDLSNGLLAAEELYVSSYPLHIQDSYETDRMNVEMDRLPAAFENDPPSPFPQDPDALYSQASLQAQYGNLPESVSHLGAGGNGLVLGEDVEIVQVGTGEPEEPEATPVITQIFSLADSTPVVSETERELLQLLQALRRTVLPAHWVGLMVEGPRLQLLQCSKLSTMADTVLQIEPGFFYQISVQDQPLLLTHPLYEAHPPRLTRVEQVVSMLLDLEQHTVCQGYPSCVPRPDQEPVLYVRAAACGLLVPRSEQRCEKCDITQPVM